MWNLNNVILEIKLNSEKYRKRDINLFLEMSFTWPRGMCVLWWNFWRKHLLKSKKHFGKIPIFIAIFF